MITAISLMLLASKSITRFVNNHPTIVILCLSCLLMAYGGRGNWFPYSERVSVRRYRLLDDD